MNASTPICRTCGCKFPGRETCKSCGADPNGTPSPQARAARAIKNVEPGNKGRRRALKRSIMQEPRKRKHARQ